MLVLNYVSPTTLFALLYLPHAPCSDILSIQNVLNVEHMLEMH
jgi:hypothetical protein